MIKTVKTESGFSLIEILVTILILTITSLVIFKFSRNTVMMDQDTRSNDTAYLAAEQKITDLATMVFQTLPQSSNDVVTIGDMRFTRNWIVEQNGYIVCATVTVHWNSLEGTNRKITLSGAIN